MDFPQFVIRLKKVVIIAVSVSITALTMACASGPTVTSPDGNDHEIQGKASWYGEPFHGRTTASGEPYNMYEMTAAHKTLPFGTVVRVRVVENRKNVIVRITDRGPYADGRIIDLSYAAAQEVGMVQAGIVEVELEVLNW